MVQAIVTPVVHRSCDLLRFFNMAGSMRILACLLMASTMVQADQCSSADERKSSNSPESVVSLLQTKLQINVLEEGVEDAQAYTTDAPTCPAEVNSLAVDRLPHDSKKERFTRVMMADYPSSGASWLKSLLRAVAIYQKVGNPDCAIYSEGNTCQLSSDVNCVCEGFSPVQDAALVKSHYPSQELFAQTSLHSWQYNATMKYDRIVQLVRHPIAIAASYLARWGEKSGHSYSQVSRNIHCWGEWWERVKKNAGDTNVFVLRYEDLCMNTSAKVHEVLQFLGGRFASISRARVNAVLAAQPHLACIHKQHLRSQTQVKHLEFMTKDNEGLMARWGYRTDGTSEWELGTEGSHMASEP